MPPQAFAFDHRDGFVDFYRETGFVIVNKVYSKDDIAALTKACDELSARRRADGKFAEQKGLGGNGGCGIDANSRKLDSG